MNINQLKTLCALVEANSLAEAAQQLNKTQPALSIALKNLEHELGLEIIDRKAYRLTLTEAGQMLYKKATAILHQEKQFHALAKHLKQGKESQLHIAYDPSFIDNSFFNTIKPIQQSHAHTEFFFHGSYRLGAIAQVVKQESVIAISPWLPTFPESNQLVSKPIKHFKMIPAIHHALVEVSPQSTDDLNHIPYLMPERFEINLDSDKLLRIDAQSYIKVSDSITQKHLIKNQMGWGLIPETIVREELESGDIIQPKLRDYPNQISGEIHIIKHRNSHLGPVASEIWEAF